jgi:hypothetical protein
MKIIVSIATFLSVNLCFTFGQEINKSQWTLMVKRTADWCSNCGSWGWNFKSKCLEEFKNEPFAFVAMHTSGNLFSPASTKLSNLFTGAGQPIFYVDGTDINVSSGNINSSLNEVKDILAFNKSVGAFAGIGIDAIYNPSNNKINIKSKVEVLQDIDESEMSINFYILQDKIAYQSNIGNNAEHKNVLLKSAFENGQGEEIFKGQILKGSIYSKDATIDVGNEDHTSLSVLAVLWNKSNNKYLYFNSYEVPVKLQSATDDRSNEILFSTFSNEASDIVVTLDHAQTDGNLSISLSDVQGRILQKLTNIQQTNVLSNPGNPGIYFVSVNSKNRSATKQVIVY